MCGCENHWNDEATCTCDCLHEKPPTQTIAPSGFEADVNWGGA